MNGGKVAGILLLVGGVAGAVWAWKAGVFGGAPSSGGTVPGAATITYQAVPA